MGDISENISRHELLCRCGECGLDSMDWETIQVVQDVCDHFSKLLGISKVTLIINSAARCVKHNRFVGGSEGSYHPKCRALDIKIIQVSPDRVADYLENKYPNKYGIGRYETFTHIDTRTDGPARWRG